MLFVKRLSFFIAGIILICILVFWGFKNNFPGESISRALQLHLTNQTGLLFEIKPLELDWLKIKAPEIDINLSKLLGKNHELKILTLKNLEFFFIPILIPGKIIITGEMSGGMFRLSTDSIRQEIININLQ